MRKRRSEKRGGDALTWPHGVRWPGLGPGSLRLHVLAALLMIVLAWTMADRAVALCLSFGLLTFLAYSWVFQANFVCVCILLGLISASSTSSSARLLALAAFVLSLPALILGDQATEQQIAQFDHDHGLDRPIVAQYFTWISRLALHAVGCLRAGASPVTPLFGSAEHCHCGP